MPTSQAENFSFTSQELFQEKIFSPEERIDGLLDAYSRTLVNGTKAAFKQIVDRFSPENVEGVRNEQVNVACWTLAQNPETRGQAVLLRSLYIVHEIDRFVASGRADTFLDLYPFHTYENQFWQGVDYEVGALLSELQAVRAGELDASSNQQAIHFELLDSGYLEFGDYVVHRRPTTCPNGEVGFVDYVVGHKSLFEGPTQE